MGGANRTSVLHRIRRRLNPRRGIVATIGDEQLGRVWADTGRSLSPPPIQSETCTTSDMPSTRVNMEWYSDYKSMPRLFMAETAEIEFISNQLHLPNVPFGESFFVEGDWEKHPRTIDEGLDFLASFRRHLDGTPWSETAYYQRRLGELTQTRAFKRGARFRDSQGLKVFLEQIEKVYLDIQKEGYRVLPNQNQIYVNIDREGRLLLTDGRHRFAFTRILGIDRIPVAIRFVHSRWQVEE